MLVYIVLVLLADGSRDFYGAFYRLQDACAARTHCREMQSNMGWSSPEGHCVVYTASLGRQYTAFDLPCPVDSENVGFADEQ